MKRTHRGFTLVELLIVIAVIGALAIMMTMSSSEAVDSAKANAIMGNLQTLKTAAYHMYMNKAGAGFITSISFKGEETIPDPSVKEASRDKVVTVLKTYLGKESSDIIGADTSSYGLVANATSWYVVYKLADTDTAGVKTRLAANAKKAELLGATSNTADTVKAAYYTNATGETHVALKVR